MHGIEIEQIANHDLRTQSARCARSSSVRTIARTALPCFDSSSVTVRPTAPTRPAAPVTRIGFVIFFPLMPSVKSKADFDQPFGTVHPWGRRRCAHSNLPRLPSGRLLFPYKVMEELSVIRAPRRMLLYFLSEPSRLPRASLDSRGLDAMPAS